MDPWLHSSFDDALMFQARCFPDHLTAMEQTSERWQRGMICRIAEPDLNV
jgi:hypothetical protein